MAFLHHESQECTKSELDLFTIPATQTSITKGQWIEYHPLRNITDSGPIEFKRECPLRPIGTWHMMKNRISSYLVHS